MPAPVVVATAQVKCSFGAAPTPLVVLPTARVLGGVLPVAAIADDKPIVNIPTFGMCMSPANPAVAAATTAAMGVLTPMPCVPAIVAPWTPGNPMVLIGGLPVVTATSTCMCNWGGVINVVSPGQGTVMA